MGSSRSSWVPFVVNDIPALDILGYQNGTLILGPTHILMKPHQLHHSRPPASIASPPPQPHRIHMSWPKGHSSLANANMQAKLHSCGYMRSYECHMIFHGIHMSSTYALTRMPHEFVFMGTHILDHVTSWTLVRAHIASSHGIPDCWSECCVGWAASQKVLWVALGNKADVK